MRIPFFRPSELAERRDVTQLVEEAVLRYMRSKRWFAGKGRDVAAIRMLKADPVVVDALPEWVCSVFSATFSDGTEQNYFLPLSLRQSNESESRPEACIAELSGGPGCFHLLDALGDDRFCLGLLQALRKSCEVSLHDGMLRFSSTRSLQSMDTAAAYPVIRPKLEQSHSSYLLGDKLIVKIYRQIQEGLSPELEIGRHLTTKASFSNIARVGGAVEYLAADGKTTTLAVVQEFVPNDGDCWSHTLAHLARLSETISRNGDDSEGEYPDRMETLGERVGTLHAILAEPSDEPAFAPEAVSDADWAGWTGGIGNALTETLREMERSIGSIPELHHAAVREVCAAGECLLAWVRSLHPDLTKVCKTRLHGDLHLGQILVAKQDFVIIDFEGEPARPLAERRRKHLPMRDVAGMMRSFGYAAQMTVQKALRENAGFDLKMPAFAAMWEKRIGERFLTGYLRGAGGAVSVPRDRDVFQVLLNLFMLEKAAYECSYELNNRPGWIGIPISGMMNIIKNIQSG